MNVRPAVLIEGHWTILVDGAYQTIKKAMYSGDQYVDVERASVKSEEKPEGTQPKLLTLRVDHISILSRNFTEKYTEKENIITGEVS